MINLNSMATPKEIKVIASMSNEDRANLIAEINATDPFTFFDSVEGKEGKEIICPFCGSGSGKNHTGIRPTLKDGVWLYHCFVGNDCEGTLLSIIATANNLLTRGKDFFEVLAIAANILRINIFSPADESPQKSTLEKKIMTPTTKQPAKEFENLAKAQHNLENFVQSKGGTWRGLSLQTLQRINCGFLPDVYFPAAKKELPAVVIPNDSGGVYFRSITGKFHKNNSPMATTTIFLPDTDNFDIVITEGQINAASIFQAVQGVTNDLPDFGIMACSGTSGENLILDKLQQFKSQGKKFRVILAFDNDSNNAGQNAADKTLKTLIKASFAACTIDFTKTPDTDLNDVLRRDNGDFQLFNLIQETLAQATDTAFLDILKKQKSRDTISLNTKNKHGSCNIETPRKESFTMSDSDCSKQISDSQGVNALQPEKSIHTQFTRVNHQEIEEPIHTHFTQIKKSKREGFYTASEAAKILGVDRTTIIYWRKKNLFVEDLLDHHGVYLYNRERVEQLKSVYRKDWQRAWAKGDSDVDSDTDTADDSCMQEVTETDIDGETDAFEIEKKRVMEDSLYDAEINNFFIPLPYVVTKHGVKKIGKKDISLICPRAILIKEKFFNLEDKTFKLILEHINGHGKWRNIPAQSRGTILNKNRIVDCINYGLPIETGNAAKVVSWLSNLELANEDFIPLTYTVNRCGWFNYKDTDFFIDPRITNSVKKDGKNIDIKVDSDNPMAKELTTAGTLEKWNEAYLMAASSTVARFNVAASVASALLKPLGERNFVCYTFGKTRSGKSTSLYLAASAVGNSGLVRVFDATTNGLTAAAMNTNHFSFFVDEKQSADAKLKSNYQVWIYNDSNGTERTRADKNGNPKPVHTWTHITLCNGETLLLDDNATGGAFTRILQIAAPDTILDPVTSKKIRKIIAENYGHALPLFIQQLFKEDFEELRERFQSFQSVMLDYCKDKNIQILPDYVRYIALVSIADQILNEALGNNIGGLEYGDIFRMLPTTDETEDSNRAENIVSAFIAMKAAHFDGNSNRVQSLDCYGRYKDGYLYIIATVLNDFLTEKGFTPSKVARDLTDSGYFTPANKTTESKRKTPPTTVQVKINGKNQRCYKIKTAGND